MAYTTALVQCKHCDTLFDPINCQQLYCSTRCQARAAKARKRARIRASRPIKPPPRTECKDCGSPDVLWWVGRIKHPGSAGCRCHPCYLRYTRLRQNPLYGGDYKPKPAPPVSKQPVSKQRTGICVRCQTPFTTSQPLRTYCSRQCMLQALRDRQPPKPTPPPKPPKPPAEYLCFPPAHQIYPRICTHCGTPFIGRRHNALRCSKQCRIDNVNSRVMGFYNTALANCQIPRAMHWHRELCHILADRAGHSLCALCGQPVDITLSSGPRGTGDSRQGPSIDHIIPRSKGGSDDLDNLQLTHWGCNADKSNKYTPIS